MVGLPHVAGPRSVVEGVERLVGAALLRRRRLRLESSITRKPKLPFRLAVLPVSSLLEAASSRKPNAAFWSAMLFAIVFAFEAKIAKPIAPSCVAIFPVKVLVSESVDPFDRAPPARALRAGLDEHERSNNRRSSM